MLPPISIILFGHPNNNSRRKEILQPLMMPFSPASCYVLHLR